jgi:putative transposase
MPNPDHAGWRSRGYLPHFDAAGLVQHLVFRLADSLPAGTEVTAFSPAARAEAIDAALDRGYGRGDLAIPEIANLVQSALLEFEGRRYALIAWCVMPNHVHVLAEIHAGNRLDRLVHSWKSYTAKAANRILERHGAFWAPEYFDRYIRDDGHLAATRAYIEGNPVKAGLCRDASDWTFSSASMRSGGRDARGPKA